MGADAGRAWASLREVQGASWGTQRKSGSLKASLCGILAFKLPPFNSFALEQSYRYSRKLIRWLVIAVSCGRTMPRGANFKGASADRWAGTAGGEFGGHHYDVESEQVIGEEKNLEPESERSERSVHAAAGDVSSSLKPVRDHHAKWSPAPPEQRARDETHFVVLEQEKKASDRKRRAPDEKDDSCGEPATKRSRKEKKRKKKGKKQKREKK